MKIIHFFLISFLSIFLFSCKNNEIESNENKIQVNDSLKMMKGIDSFKPMSNIQNLTIDSNFIGHTSKDYDSLQVCFAHIIEDKVYNTNIDFVLLKLSQNIESCNNGKEKVILEKFVKREGQKAIFIITDELNFNSKKTNKIYSSLYFKLSNETKEMNYLIEHENSDKEYLEKVSKLWIINLKTEKFEETKVPENYKFQNPDYADGI